MTVTSLPCHWSLVEFPNQDTHLFLIVGTFCVQKLAHQTFQFVFPVAFGLFFIITERQGVNHLCGLFNASIALHRIALGAPLVVTSDLLSLRVSAVNRCFSPIDDGGGQQFRRSSRGRCAFKNLPRRDGETRLVCQPPRRDLAW